MEKPLNEDKITQALRDLGKTPVDPAVYDRAWFKVEEKIFARQKPLLGHLVWRPWGHPIRWAAAAALMFVVYSGVLYDNYQTQDNLGDFVETVSQPTANLAKDPGIVHVSSLMSDGPSGFREMLFSDEDNDSLSNDDLSL